MAEEPQEEVMDINAWLDQHGQTVVDFMYPDGDAPEDFDVAALVKRPERLVLRVSTPDKAVLVKAFSTEPKMEVLRNDRELLVLLALRETPLIPDILTYSRVDKWVLTEWISGGMLEHKVKPENALMYARKLGRWFAEYTEVMQEHGIQRDSDWFSYLQAYGQVARNLDYSDHESFLSSLPLCERLIAKNDAFLGNFLVSEDDRLVGIDFEKSQLKPYGWDILVTARVLVRKFPTRYMELTEALVKGWGQGTDCISQKDFLKLVRIFTANTAFALQEDIPQQASGQDVFVAAQSAAK